MRLGIITCHFNPLGLRRPVENYWRFRAGLGEFAADLTTVELTFDGQAPVIPDAIQLTGTRERHFLWQKETLLNVALRSLPAQYDAVAWIDADVLFDSPTWHADTLELLERVPVVQLFEQARFLDAAGQVTQEINSSAWVHHHRVRGLYGQPGLAWAIRREVIEPQGFVDAHVVGGGDDLMRACWTGVWHSWMFQNLPVGLRRHTLRWGARQWPQVQGRLQPVPGTIRHLFHGTRENRKYADRTRYLLQHDFNPDADVIREPSGLLAWSGAKPQLQATIRDWFEGRKEDE